MLNIRIREALDVLLQQVRHIDQVLLLEAASHVGREDVDDVSVIPGRILLVDEVDDVCLEPALKVEGVQPKNVRFLFRLGRQASHDDLVLALHCKKLILQGSLLVLVFAVLVHHLQDVENDLLDVRLDLFEVIIKLLAGDD